MSLSRGLLTYLSFDKGIKDLVKNINLNTSSVVTTPGKVNNAAAFSGSGSSIIGDYTNQRYAILNNDASFAFWVKITGGQNEQIFYGEADGSGQLNTAAWNIRRGGGNPNRIYIFSNGSAPSLDYDGGLFNDTWYHIAATKIGDLFSIYVNGEISSTGIIANASLGFNPSLNKLFLGDLGADPTSGLIDEFARWNRGLSLSEVQQLYNDGNGMSINISSSNFFPFFK